MKIKPENYVLLKAAVFARLDSTLMVDESRVKCLARLSQHIIEKDHTAKDWETALAKYVVDATLCNNGADLWHPLYNYLSRTNVYNATKYIFREIYASYRKEKSLDGRYKIGKEYCGTAYPQYAVYFCNEFLGRGLTISAALLIAEEYEETRWRRENK